MKIALVCNMNNNNFSLMRYLRDLGVDAHLFPFAGEHEHFRPECDTWEIEKWQPYIHVLDFRNSQYDLVLKTGRSIRKHFAGFDSFIGSGLAPALLAKAGIQLDIFYPYSTGVEYAGGRVVTDIIKNGPLKRRLFYRYIQWSQIRALRKARFCINPIIDGYTEQVFHSLIGRSFEAINIPMVYNRENVYPENIPCGLKIIKTKLEKYDFVILSHARHWWHPSTFEQYKTDFTTLYNKHNDWLIKGFSMFVTRRSNVKPLLVLFEYGSDIEYSKHLVHELDITPHVLWLPQSLRKEIMYLLSISDIGVGEFPSRGIWGGTGWETLAAGKPLMQSVNYSIAEFRSLFGYELPPILDVKSPEDVACHLEEFINNRDHFVEMGRQSKKWFDENNGIKLAARYLELLQS